MAALSVLAACVVPSRLPKQPPSGPTAGVGEPIAAEPELAVQSVQGEPQRPFDLGYAQAHVLLFVTPDCPIANAYAPEIGRLVRDYGPRGVRVFVVYVTPGLSAGRAREHATEYDLRGTLVLDPEHALAGAVGATRTPEAAVVVAGPRLAYRGRIDDLYPELGVRRPTGATRHDLRDALDQLLAGRPIEEPRTVAVGCDLPQR